MSGTEAGTTKSQVMTALGKFILSLVSCEVVQGLDNRVPMPKGDFVVMTPILSPVLATNVSTFDAAQGTETLHRSTRYDVQVDCYGATASDRAALLSMMLRSEYACNSFAASGYDVQPLYAEDPHQLPFVNAEAQYEERWSFTAALQFSPAVSTPMEFFDEAKIGLYEVDTTYPPE